MSIYHTENQTKTPNLLHIITGCSKKSEWTGQAFTNFVTEDYSFSYNYLKAVSKVNWFLTDCSGGGKIVVRMRRYFLHIFYTRPVI